MFIHAAPGLQCIGCIPIQQRSALQSGEHPSLKTALKTHIFRMIEALNGLSPYRDLEIRALPLKIRDRLVSESKGKLGKDNKVQQKMWTAEIDGMTMFLASHGRFPKFIQLHNTRGCRGHGEAAFRSEVDTCKCTIEVSKILCFFDSEDIPNAGEA